MRRCLPLLVLLLVAIAVAGYWYYQYQHKPQQLTLRYDPDFDTLAPVLASGDVLMAPDGGIKWHGETPCVEADGSKSCTIKKDAKKKVAYRFDCVPADSCDPEIIPDDPGSFEKRSALTAPRTASGISHIDISCVSNKLSAAPDPALHVPVGGVIKWAGNAGLTDWKVRLDNNTWCESTTGGSNTDFNQGNPSCTRRNATMFQYALLPAGTCTTASTATIGAP